jgi:S-adenosylmethionine-diacylglycerol 3-amino-3-carboxypropyl transferase
MKSEIQDHAEFLRIRYAQCWEDADILCEALQTERGGRHLSIGSAGDNSFALLAQGASHVTVVEMNPAQVACIDLRKAGYLQLDHEEFLQLLGIHSHAERWSLFEKCRSVLKEETIAYWTHHRATFESGIVHGGKFENYFRLFRERVLPLAHSRRRVQDLLAPRTPAERQHFYQSQWNNRRWRLIFRAFFSRFMMGRLGRDPSFFRYVEGSVADRILERTRHALVELDPARNPYLHFILTGTFGSTLPLALRPEAFDRIKKALQRDEAFTLFSGSLEEALNQPRTNPFDGFNLSDIFEYMSEDNTEDLLKRILSAAHPGARLAYWNMLAPRARPESLATRLQPQEETAQRLFLQDQAFFYSRFVIEEVTSPS